MPSARQLPSQVSDTLAQGGIVLCANARAARSLSELYGAQQQAKHGRHAWQSPRIFDWRPWLHTQWQSLLLGGTEKRTLLSTLQEEVLWHDIVQPTVERHSLIAPAEVARLAMRAYALLGDFDATSSMRTATWDQATLEPKLFRKWAMEMERRCDRNQWLCRANLAGVIGSALTAGQLSPPSAVAWNGFDRLTPAEREFRRVLDAAGCAQMEVAWHLTAGEHLVAAPSLPDELEACAEWARAQLAMDPRRSIGILLPDVESRRDELDRVFRRVLMPEAAGLTTHEPAPVYEFTLGLPLANVPAIAAALLLLRWFIRPHEQEVITWIMTTGFFGSENAAPLAEADIKLRKYLSVPDLGIEDALSRLSIRIRHWTEGDWVKRIKSARKVLQKQVGTQPARQLSYAQWVSTTAMMLKQAGWPGEHTFDSVAFQVRKRWQQALDEVSALSWQDRRCSYAEFLDVLESHLRISIFAPESQGAPITVSGILESAGRSFDAVWVLGATDDAWPARSPQHSLLPPWLQKDIAMPGTAEQDRLLADAAFARLRTTTNDLIFSYAMEGAEGAQRPSSLLASLDVEILEALPVTQVALLETIADEMVVPWPGGRSAGGQEVLKRQSACPFQTFAARRLAAGEMPSPEPGLNAAQRGSVVHAALERVWKDIAGSERLRHEIATGELPAVIRKHTAAAIAKYKDKAVVAWEREYLQLEQDRVCTLLEQWLQLENKRAAFEVELIEQTKDIVIEGLELTVRMDRIDRVEGGRILIDYKTSAKVKQESWFGERLAEPQLPLYAVTGKVEGLRDVLFGHVRQGDSKFLSAVFDEKPDIFPRYAAKPGFDTAACFDDLCVQWTAALGALSREFQQGLATVTPKDVPSTCKYCAYPGLCRIGETRSDFARNEDES